jgi:uncharacterized protein YqfB (UPF0267 family)
MASRKAQKKVLKKGSIEEPKKLDELLSEYQHVYPQFRFFIKKAYEDEQLTGNDAIIYANKRYVDSKLTTIRNMLYEADINYDIVQENGLLQKLILPIMETEDIENFIDEHNYLTTSLDDNLIEKLYLTITIPDQSLSKNNMNTIMRHKLFAYCKLSIEGMLSNEITCLFDDLYPFHPQTREIALKSIKKILSGDIRLMKPSVGEQPNDEKVVTWDDLYIICMNGWVRYFVGATHVIPSTYPQNQSEQDDIFGWRQ